MKYLKKYESWQSMVGTKLNVGLKKHVGLYDKDPETVKEYFTELKNDENYKILDKKSKNEYLEQYMKYFLRHFKENSEYSELIKDEVFKDIYPSIIRNEVGYNYKNLDEETLKYFIGFSGKKNKGMYYSLEKLAKILNTNQYNDERQNFFIELYIDQLVLFKNANKSKDLSRIIYSKIFQLFTAGKTGKNMIKITEMLEKKRNSYERNIKLCF